MLNSLMQTWTISLGQDTGGYCHEIFLRGKSFLAQRITSIPGKKLGASRKILPNFYTLDYLPESEPKNLRAANDSPPEAKELKYPRETYLPPMSQTRFSASESVTNMQLFSLRNLLPGSAVTLEHQQRTPGLFGGVMPILKQGFEPPINRITGSAMFPPFVPTSTNSQMLSLTEIMRASRAGQLQHEDSSHHVWALQNPPALQVNPFVGWHSNNSQLPRTWPVALRQTPHLRMDGPDEIPSASERFPVLPHQGGKLSWQESYENLVAYKDHYGDCIVPQKYKGNPKLGGWVNKQRKKDKNPTKYGLLKREHEDLLTDLGFKWY
jgi:hypothetical protein